MEIGLYTLSDLTADPHTHRRLDARTRIAETIAAAQLAEAAGLDVFGVGEHHRLDFAVSSPAVVLAAIAQTTQRIRLTSAVTVLGALDPVRVFEDFATLDLVSRGRAELIVGRGAYVESFPLFGADLRDYDDLFVERYELLRELSRSERVRWSGRFRSALVDAQIAPRPLQQEIPLWIAVGGTPASAERAGKLGAPMTLAVLGGPIANIKPMVDRYRAAGKAAGHDDSALRVALSSHLHVGETSQTARATFYPHYAQYWSEVTSSPPMSSAQFAQLTGRGSALLVGSANEVAERMIEEHALLGHQRMLMQIDLGALPFKEVASVIERLATKVLPQVRTAIGPH